MRFVGRTTVLVLSIEYWEPFADTHLNSIQISPISFFSFINEANNAELAKLSRDYKILFIYNQDQINNSISIYSNHCNIGNIIVKVHESNYRSERDKVNKVSPPYPLLETIYLTGHYIKLAPLIEFIKSFMQYCGDGQSIGKYLATLGKEKYGLNFT